MKKWEISYHCQEFKFKLKTRKCIYEFELTLMREDCVTFNVFNVWFVDISWLLFICIKMFANILNANND